jgi:hypothetical protein
MKLRQVLFISLVVLVAVSSSSTLILAQGPTGTGKALAPLVSAGTAITYQGQLKKNGAPYSGSCNLLFALYDQSSAGTLLVGPMAGTPDPVAVTNGLLDAQVDFGSSFTGDDRWLDIQVKCAGDAAFTPLGGRQHLTAAPYAVGLRSGASMVTSLGGDAFSVTNAGSGDALNGYGLGTGRGVYGSSTASAGVYGVSSSSVGVLGSAPTGVRGVTGLPSGITPLYDRGVWGDSTSSYGVAGTSDTNSGVIGNSNSGIGVEAHSTNGRGLWARSENGVGLEARSINGNPLEVYGFDGGNRRFYVSNTGNVFADGSFSPGGADVAERLDASEPLLPGDVVELDPAQPDHYRLARSPSSTLVAGVISTNPGVIMNNTDLAGNDQQPVLALAGKTPVRVTAENGPIQIGDLLVSSATPGAAMKAGPNPAAGTVIGKAVQALESGQGAILMLVMLR